MFHRAAAYLEQNIGEFGGVHVNDQTVVDEVLNPFGGPGASGNYTRMGGVADPALYTQWRWLTIKDAPPRYPF